MESQKPRGFVFFLRDLHGARKPLPSRAVLTLHMHSHTHTKVYCVPGTMLPSSVYILSLSLPKWSPTDNTPWWLNYDLSIGQAGGRQPGDTALGKVDWLTAKQTQRETWGIWLKRENTPRTGFLIWLRFLCKSPDIPKIELSCNCHGPSEDF